ncbi:MAG: hypothetical protein IH948_05435, partial [Bacteroidetes bacterium]|nr:hypothetical protein [Bacteroidota bacterium]
MIKSMTGYGKKLVEQDEKRIQVQIKTLNSKQLDISLKMPDIFRDKELEIRSMLSEKFLRGKVDVHISIEDPLRHVRSALGKRRNPGRPVRGPYGTAVGVHRLGIEIADRHCESDRHPDQTGPIIRRTAAGSGAKGKSRKIPLPRSRQDADED